MTPNHLIEGDNEYRAVWGTIGGATVEMKAMSHWVPYYYRGRLLHTPEDNIIVLEGVMYNAVKPVADSWNAHNLELALVPFVFEDENMGRTYSGQCYTCELGTINADPLQVTFPFSMVVYKMKITLPTHSAKREGE